MWDVTVSVIPVLLMVCHIVVYSVPHDMTKYQKQMHMCYAHVYHINKCVACFNLETVLELASA